MLDKPENYDDLKEWFTWFRMTKYLPAMPTKFEAALAEAPDARAARTVMTAYAAASLDVVFFIPLHPAHDLAEDLDFLCKFKPSDMLLLSVNEVASPMKIDAPELAKRLAEGGFRIVDGTVTGYEKPLPPAEPQRRKPGGGLSLYPK